MIDGLVGEVRRLDFRDVRFGGEYPQGLFEIGAHIRWDSPRIIANYGKPGSGAEGILGIVLVLPLRGGGIGRVPARDDVEDNATIISRESNGA